ncbi:hypothetical protein K8I85_03530 [bacterium]|nr:hypothetical protein [bacterium]
MKTVPTTSMFLAGALFLAAGASAPAPGAPLGTGFTYQGELSENGVPVTGTAHLRFRLYDAPGSGSPPVGGSQIGSSQIVADVPVTDGVFTVILDDAGQFGATAFHGDARWIQLEICDDAFCSSSTVLAPRQPVTGVSYALTSVKPWDRNGTNLSYSAGNVGIGTTAPASRLHVKAAYSGDGIRLEGGAGAAPGYQFVDGVLDRGSLGLATAPGLWSTDAAGGDIVLRSTAGKLLLQNGFLGSALAISGNNVGIGTPSPAARLDVRGDIRLGAAGQHFAPYGEESLRVMRGQIAADGSPMVGCCFSCVRPSTGVYDISFVSAFSGVPTVIISTDGAGIATVTAPGTGSFRVLMNSSGSPVNGGFHFIVMGPR